MLGILYSNIVEKKRYSQFVAGGPTILTDMLCMPYLVHSYNI